MTSDERETWKVMTICTIDVHSRDVVSKMILNKIESSFAFSWQSQLRHRYLNFDEALQHILNIT